MHIAFAASECVPFVKTGGLADVIGALPQELVRQGHELTTWLPLFRQVAAQMMGKRKVGVQPLRLHRRRRQA
jgi:starch synthase